MSAFYTWANGEELVAGNPARLALTDKTTKALLVSKQGKKQPYLKFWSEVMRLYAALKTEDPAVAVFYLLQARAGLRPGEAPALQWGDVDLDARQLTVERQVRHGKTGTTKSGKTRHRRSSASWPRSWPRGSCSRAGCGAPTSCALRRAR